MSRNKVKLIQNQVDRMLSAYMDDDFSSAIMKAKRIIEQVCTLLLRKENVFPEEYNQKKNRHIEWNIEKKIKECENNDSLESDLCAELYLIKDWRNNIEHSKRSNKKNKQEYYLGVNNFRLFDKRFLIEDWKR